ncbi:MAG: helix-turn-helix domain-containing protein [Clostridia bacterium]|nr:helix-turn-helix domain-containing protein [Clostridia bacterium]
MYQIFVVEDELLIRQSIRNAIEHMQGPYAFCGEASDGEMALSMMQDLMPDILLTDIRMPFLDGFGLIRHAKAMMPWLKIAIISGYGDFESAQQAISLGVDQYLLKPVLTADLVRAIEAMAAQIEKSKAARSTLPAGLDEDEVLGALRQAFLRQLLYGGSDTGELLEKARTLQLDIIRSHYLVCVCSFDAPDMDQRVLKNTVHKALNGMDNTMCCFNSLDQMTLLDCDNDPEALNERVYRFINILHHELADVCPVITTVIGDEVQRLGAICDAYKTAAGLLKTVSGIAPGQVINVSDTAQITADILQLNSPFGTAFQQKLQYAGPDDVPRLLDEVLQSPAGEQFDSLLMRYNALIVLLRTAVQMTVRNSPDADEKDIAAQLSSQFNILAAAGSRESFRRTAEELLRRALSVRQETPGEMKYSHVISRAEKYVHDNFCDPNISLISVARHIGMSPAHFCTVFSQIVGRPFIAYLTALRMQRAKELLRGTNMRLSDIAMEIGYNEPNYFSHVFRKTEGMTPKEYRSRQSGTPNE